MSIDLTAIGRDLKKPIENIESAVKLLDDGNTIPFITRFRKDQTGGLNEEQLLQIKTAVSKLRALAERKAFVSKSIDSQGKLTDKLTKQIEAASTSRKLEDIYLLFKPKKQTLATTARQQGLEPLALDIFEGREPEKDLATRATDFVRVDKNLSSVDEVIAGVGHILAEKFSDNMSLRNELRAIISKGKIETHLIELEADTAEKENKKDTPAASQKEQKPDKATGDSDSKKVATDESEAAKPKDGNPGDAKPQGTSATGDAKPEETKAADAEPEDSTAATASATVKSQHLPASDSSSTAEVKKVEAAAEEKQSEDSKATVSTASADSPDEQATLVADESKSENASPAAKAETQTAETVKPAGDAKPTEGSATPAADSVPKKKKKKKKKKKVDDPYKDFRDFSHPVSSMPYHKTLAINRGEKSGRLKVKIQYNDEAFLEKANSTLVTEEHPFKEFMHGCVRDAMSRLVTPSLERELRREMTEAAEQHAVQVFARNLKSLLLRTPTRDRIVLAIDPGYKRGCSVAIVDPGGHLLADAHIFVVGNDKRKSESKQKLADLVKQHGVHLIAIGNGTACREAEQMVSELIEENSLSSDLKYAIINEAGASFYSTSEVGREEFPELSPAVRSAVSIGRRLIDPLSELVKISPANIGVGLYQHDVKAKHLSESLDEVVQFCVNRVGIDVNTASPSLLKYVSGLNQLTARRVFEYRMEKGPFKNREQLKEVTGFGDATFVQSAGFLRVRGGDQALDTTGVHPDHYDAASKVMEKVGAKPEELFPIASQVVEEDAKSAEVSTAAANGDKLAATTIEKPSTEEPKQTAENPVEAAKATESIPESSAAAEAATTSEPTAPAETAPADSTENATNSLTADAEKPAESAPEAEASSSKTEEQSASTENKTPASTDETKKAETQPVAKKTVRFRLTPEQQNRRKELVKSIRELDADKLAGELGVGRLMLKDILHSICRPEYDPRRNVNRPVFRSGIIKLDDLKKDMCLDAQVVNVVDFGAFVDIGLGTSCLVHVSQLANHFIRDPHRFFAVGDTLRVWVTEIDSKQRRVKLTAVQPQELRPKREPRSKSFRKPGSQKPSGRRDGRRDGKRDGKRAGASSGKRFSKPRRPKPVKPITDDMLQGAEPMRSFSDLAQFYDKKPDDKDGKKGS